MKANWNSVASIEPPATMADLIESESSRPAALQALRQSVEFLDVLGVAPETATADEEMAPPRAV